MENKFLGYENEAELTDLVDSDVTAAAGIPTSTMPGPTIPILITKFICPTSACTSRCR